MEKRRVSPSCSRSISACALKSSTKTFNNNPTFAHGFVVVIEDAGWERIYFLANDMDHPIE